ncbi:MAG: GNAT family N-acetyltransferase [Bacteroidales bacterium]|nr:GNAT family N-acetyltransferase [Bacteroidales bacterium]
MMELKRLMNPEQVCGFDCGDGDLNGFLIDDAYPSAQKHIANTFILLDDGKTVAYFCLLTDKITKIEMQKADWRRLRRLFPRGKQYSSYPSIKIGRFAVDASYSNKGIGTSLMRLIKLKLLQDVTFPAFRFLPVDAYLSAIPFYKRNGFKLLEQLDDDQDTRLMYYDMLSLIEQP